MPTKVAFEPEAGVVVLELGGEVTLDETEEALEAIPSRPWFRPRLKMVADARNCTTRMTGKDVERLAAFARQLDDAWGETRWAVLAPDDLVYGLARIYMALTEDYQVQTHVFRNVQDVNDWLGIGVDIEEILKRAA